MQIDAFTYHDFPKKRNFYSQRFLNFLVHCSLVSYPVNSILLYIGIEEFTIDLLSVLHEFMLYSAVV